MAFPATVNDSFIWLSFSEKAILMLLLAATASGCSKGTIAAQYTVQIAVILSLRT